MFSLNCEQTKWGLVPATGRTARAEPGLNIKFLGNGRGEQPRWVFQGFCRLLAIENPEERLLLHFLNHLVSVMEKVNLGN